MKKMNLMNKRFGKLLVLKQELRNNMSYCFCRCDCGNTKWIRGNSLKQGKTKSCGCVKYKRLNNLSNKKFGNLTAISLTGNSNKNNGRIWRCKCDCGNFIEVSAGHLTSGAIISCGCVKKDKVKENVKRAFIKNKEVNFIDGTNVSYIKREAPIRTNTSGVTGVSFNRKNRMWIAKINFKNKTYYLGSFKNKEEAIKVRKEAEEKLFKPFLKSLEEE